MCATENGQVLCPGEKTYYSPAAVFIIRQGSISFADEGGLQQIGIIDAREWPDNGLPALVSESVSPESLSFNRVFFKGQYPLVSDIDDNHPYWNNNEQPGTESASQIIEKGMYQGFGILIGAGWMIGIASAAILLYEFATDPNSDWRRRRNERRREKLWNKKANQ